MARRILLIEDNRPQAELAIDYLRKDGYEVVWAADGKSAIKKAATESFDLVLLDIILPDMHGNKICRWLKQNRETSSIPIIILSAMDTPEDMVSGFDAGADDYLNKPFHHLELAARIEFCLSTRRLQGELEAKNVQLQRLLKKVRKLAITDSLTSLYNRRYFETVLEKEFRKVVRYEFPMALIMMDIDHFKQVNDRFGHPAGDAVLISISDILIKALRDVDVVARWGGEEFVALMPQTNKDQSLRVAERIRKAVQDCHFPEIKDDRVTISLGVVSSADTRMESTGEILSLADRTLYEAKKAGRNRVKVASPAV